MNTYQIIMLGGEVVEIISSDSTAAINKFLSQTLFNESDILTVEKVK